MSSINLQKQMQIRKQKGLEIAKTGKVRLTENKWTVPSQSLNRYYEVILGIDKSVCNCPDFAERGLKCKHIFAVEMTVSKSLNQDGSVTVTQAKRIAYSQEREKGFHYFQSNQEEFAGHYHKRSNVEAMFSAIKKKLGESLKSKNRTAQINELLCKIIVYNITVLIQEMHIIGIQPNFIVVEK